MDPKLQQQLEQLGIKPSPPNAEPDLTDVLKENMAQLPVKELVETYHQTTSRDGEGHGLEAQRTGVHLEGPFAAKKTYGDMLEEMKLIQSKLEAEQGALNTTSAAYMAMVNTSKA